MSRKTVKPPVIIEEAAARQGGNKRNMLLVLAVSLALALVAGVVTLKTYFANGDTRPILLQAPKS